MKKGMVIFTLMILMLFSVPLWAEEQLMTKLYFDKWLEKSTEPLKQKITQLQEDNLILKKDVNRIRDQVTIEIKVAIGNKEACVEGQTVKLDVAPVIRNERTMVPVRFIGEAFGAEFFWEEATRKVTYLKDDNVIEIFVDKKIAKLNNKEIVLDTAPTISEGRTLVPLRFVSEHMGAILDWDDQTKTVIIYG
ncbi:MAG: copper amine oxidase N-terminal domain-containing protein [Clostridia bacterium]|nr:copper amine oxidase N-terminal domain-containing protein [Clostridia bacterium]MDD4047889.1 copper amine oxidase N-terminal domain-containing protein [Clostridia bacterium]